MRRPPHPIEVKPPMGGHLVTAPAADAGGLANYLVKRDWRREDDCELRGEGYNYFRPNSGIALGQQPLFAPGEIVLEHEVKRPNRQKCVIVGTATTLYRYFSQTGGGYYSPATYYDSDYFNDNPGEWTVIGTGFSTNGKRWQAVDLNGYVILNNGVDLPVAYRVEWSEVVPLYELRELGVASVGVIFELENYLNVADVRQIKEEAESTANTQAIMGVLSSGTAIGTQTGGVSSADAKVVGSIAAGTTVINTTGAIFLGGHAGKAVRFLNQYTATIAEVYGPTSARVDVAPAEDISGMIFVITRPAVSGGIGSVIPQDSIALNTCKAVWWPGANAPFAMGTAMQGEYYVVFDPTPEYPNGWSSGIAAVLDFQTAVLVKTAPTQISLVPFRVVPSEFVMSLSAGTFVFTDEMAGEYVLSGYKKRKIVSVVDATHAVMDTDYPFGSGALRVTNPKAYRAYTGATDGYGYRVLWGLPAKPERWGSSVACAIEAGDNRLTLDWPMKSLKAGDVVLVLGAGPSGGNLLSTVKLIIGDLIVIEGVASTPVRRVTGVKAATLTHSGTTATFTATAAHGMVSGLLVTIGGVVNKAQYNGAFNITVTGDTTFTYTMGSDPGADATTIEGITAQSEPGLLMLADSLTDAARFEDLEDDGSTILAVRKLKGIGVILRETSIFLMGDSQQTNPPFAFDLVYGGSKGGDRAGALAFPLAVANVKDEYLLYPGENDFYRFDLVTKEPQIFGPLHGCRNLFFDAAERGDDVFVADNEITREIWFCFPDSTTGDRVLKFDYLFSTESTSSARVTAACTVNRPLTDGATGSSGAPLDEKWFAVAIALNGPSGTIGALGYYGLTSGKPVKSGSITAAQAGTAVTASGGIFRQEHVGRTLIFDTASGAQVAAHIVEYVSATSVTAEPSQTVGSCVFRIEPGTWSRFGVDYESELDSAYIDFGVNSREQELRSYAPHLAEKYVQAGTGQKSEANLTAAIEIVPGKWYRLGRVHVSNVRAKFTAHYIIPDALDPYNPAAATIGLFNNVPTVEGLAYEVQYEQGLIRFLPESLAIIDLASRRTDGAFNVTFDCAGIANSFQVTLMGGLSVAKGVSQLFSRVLTDLEAGDVIKTHFRKYLFQDRLKVSGAHNSARLSMRCFEVHGVESSQIGRQARV